MQPVRESVPAVLSSAYEQLVEDALALTQQHAMFADLLDRNGLPPLWRRQRSFETLVRFILEQQVSLASANAAFRRLESRLGSVSAQGVLSSSDAALKQDGFSRQKTGYVKGLAQLILSGEFDPSELPEDQEAARESLLAIRGIGPWTAACYLLFVVGARDTWPTGDRALYVSMATNLELPAVPNREAADTIASEWAPWRSTAAKMLWYDYLGGRDYVPTEDAGFIGGTGKVLP